MNTRKRTTNRPSTSKQSSANVQRDIREVFTNIKAKTQKGALLAQSVAETSTEPIFADLSTVSSVSNESSTKKLLLKNAYARDLFFRYTNVKTVLSKKFPEHCSERTRLYYEQRVYKFYVLQPKYRIRTTLEDIRFNTRFNEGLFRMALKMPIISAQDHATYNRNLARFGVKKQCFVDMTLNNCVLEDQAKLIKTLKSKYKFWYDKLDKLPKYLSLMQRQNELDNETFLRDLEHHSSMKDCRWLELPDVVGNLVQEVWLPSEKRQCPIWIQLIFDDDALNKKYRVGSYSKFKSTLPANDPEDWIDCGASNRIHTSNQDSLLPDTMSFEPFIFSTQNQPQTNVQSIENRTVASSITRAPLQPTCTSATVVPSERSSPLIDTIRSNTAPPTPSSSIAPPFQAVYPSPTGSTPAAHRVSVPSYSIKKENLSTNATNDQHEDENVTNPEFITIESSPECNTVASFKIKEENLINDRSETAYEVYPEIITIDSSQED
ncbi:uncharacterized protein LOC128303865 isoform X2 [Anopheles moucheti]|uniref:uncharacterized protein LOC128303865 isoform X2 n=1 Tax=Anopheles moucheti TaxID=186751 RepID=UPI0022F0DB7D|nr:uncharacterized protein LOC128303865 isoform X2 [Anopheles moucheti]